MRAPALVALAIPAVALALAVPAPAQAAGCGAEPGLTAIVDGATIPLSGARRQRIPYGRDISVLVRTASRPNAVRVRFDYTEGPDGPRSGTVDAQAVPSDSTCWVAALPKVRVNEQGRYTALIFGTA